MPQNQLIELRAIGDGHCGFNSFAIAALYDPKIRPQLNQEALKSFLGVLYFQQRLFFNDSKTAETLFTELLTKKKLYDRNGKLDTTQYQNLMAKALRAYYQDISYLSREGKDFKKSYFRDFEASFDKYCAGTFGRDDSENIFNKKEFKRVFNAVQKKTREQLLKELNTSDQGQTKPELQKELLKKRWDESLHGTYVRLMSDFENAVYLSEFDLSIITRNFKVNLEIHKDYVLKVTEEPGWPKIQFKYHASRQHFQPLVDEFSLPAQHFKGAMDVRSITKRIADAFDSKKRQKPTSESKQKQKPKQEGKGKQKGKEKITSKQENDLPANYKYLFEKDKRVSLFSNTKVKKPTRQHVNTFIKANRVLDAWLEQKGEIGKAVFEEHFNALITAVQKGDIKAIEAKEKELKSLVGGSKSKGTSSPKSPGK